jgi:hypothetical protein
MITRYSSRSADLAVTVDISIAKADLAAVQWPLEKVTIKPKKADIEVRRVAPYRSSYEAAF